MGPSVTVYDISNTAAVLELFVYSTDAPSFLRFPARYVLALTGQTLDPAHSGLSNRRIIRNP